MDKRVIIIEKTQKLFRPSTFITSVIGLLINIGLSQLMLLWGVPLYLDAVGTVFVAAVCGVIPGVAVGFLTNCLNSIGDPISLYYGILNILIAIVASEASRRGLLRKIGGALLCVGIFTLIGGGLGSVMTWLLYGFSFGSGISAPFAIQLHSSLHFSEFWAQFSADVLIDLADKLLTVGIVFGCLKAYPQKLIEPFPYGYIYDKANKDVDYIHTRALKDDSLPRRRSLRIKTVNIIVVTSVILCTLAMTIGLIIYRESIQDRYESICTGAVNMMLEKIDGDKVNDYLATGGTSQDYLDTEAELATILNSFADIEYMYVYQIHEDGCHVIFDLDTTELEGEDVGTVIDFDPTFMQYLPTLLAGGEIETVISDDQYGWLLTVYKPIVDSEGTCVAYAAADVDMQQLATDSYTYFIRVAALLFGVLIIIILFALWYGESHIVSPINKLVVQAKEFAYADASRRLQDTVLLERAVVKTGDELEELFYAMRKTESEVAGYIEDINNKAFVIEKMQINTVHSFANMVESRDSDTGNHIARTAEYTRIIAEGLLEKELYPDEVNESYVKKLLLSAPLHDIGKIGISDTILNKPGKLTDEEYSIMKTHTTIGQQIIQSSLIGIEDGGYLEMAGDLAAYHHEHWNGKGYPEGRAGLDIPLCARIMAIADVFDALISKRSYKPPFSLDKAIAIIKEESGSHFEAVLVDVFLEKLPQANTSFDSFDD